MSNKQNSFGKEKHLKSRKLIKGLFNDGRSFFAAPIKMLWQITGVESQINTPYIEPVLVGVTASSRNFKKATDRNRIKRLLRESYRLNKQELEAYAAVKKINIRIFFIFIDKALPTFAIVQEKMVACLDRLQKTLGT